MYDSSFYKLNCFNGCFVHQFIIERSFFYCIKQSNFIINLERTMLTDFLTPKKILPTQKQEIWLQIMRTPLNDKKENNKPVFYCQTIVNIHLLFNDNVKLTDMNTTLQKPAICCTIDKWSQISNSKSSAIFVVVLMQII